MMVARRIGAGTYLLSLTALLNIWAYSMMWVVENLVLETRLSPSDFSLLAAIAATVVGILFYPLTASRLRDLNVPGWGVKVVAIPFFGVMALPVLLFLSGSRWDNDYGHAPEKSGLLKILAGLVLFAIAIFSVPDAIDYHYIGSHIDQIRSQQSKG